MKLNRLHKILLPVIAQTLMAFAFPLAFYSIINSIRVESEPLVYYIQNEIAQTEVTCLKRDVNPNETIHAYRDAIASNFVRTKFYAL